MQSLYRSDALSNLSRLRSYLIPRPNTGSLWLDISYLLVIIWIQSSFLTSLTQGLVNIDLVTPWLVISFIRHHLGGATLLAFIGAITLENQSAVPAGLYICTYWITANIIIQVRPALSWRHQVPWVVTYALSGLGIVLFESLAILTSLGSFPQTWTYWLAQVIRIATVVAFGMFLSQEWLRIDAEEPIPQ